MLTFYPMGVEGGGGWLCPTRSLYCRYKNIIVRFEKLKASGILFHNSCQTFFVKHLNQRYDAHLGDWLGGVHRTAEIDSPMWCTPMILTSQCDAHRGDWFRGWLHSIEFLKNSNISAKSEKNVYVGVRTKMLFLDVIAIKIHSWLFVYI